MGASQRKPVLVKCKTAVAAAVKCSAVGKQTPTKAAAERPNRNGSSARQRSQTCSSPLLIKLLTFFPLLHWGGLSYRCFTDQKSPPTTFYSLKSNLMCGKFGNYDIITNYSCELLTNKVKTGFFFRITVVFTKSKAAIAQFD